MPIRRIYYEQLCKLYGERVVRMFYTPARPFW